LYASVGTIKSVLILLMHGANMMMFIFTESYIPTNALLYTIKY